MFCLSVIVIYSTEARLHWDGRIEQYDSKEDDWPQYVEHIEYFFKEANGIVEAVNRPLADSD